MLFISCTSTPKAFGTEIIAQLILIPKREITIFLFFMKKLEKAVEKLLRMWEKKFSSLAKSLGQVEPKI